MEPYSSWWFDDEIIATKCLPFRIRADLTQEVPAAGKKAVELARLLRRNIPISTVLMCGMIDVELAIRYKTNCRLQGHSYFADQPHRISFILPRLAVIGSG